MSNKLLHFELPDKFKLNLGEDCASAVNKMLAQVADATDKLIVDAIIKYATENGFSDAYIIDEEFVKSALEKQIPKKAHISLHGTTDWNTKCRCPVCRKDVFGTQKYCGNCGQALDWGESE